MSKRNGKPCKRCGGNEWYTNGNCKHCHLERCRRRYAANSEKIREVQRYYCQSHREEARERASRWRKENLDKAQEHTRRWCKENPEKLREAIRRWKKANPDKCAVFRHRRRTRETKAGGSYTTTEWKDLCAYYDNKCLYPGCERTDLTADHVIPVAKGGRSDISNIQPLCSRHNKKKGTKTTDYRHAYPGSPRLIQGKLFG